MEIILSKRSRNLVLSLLGLVFLTILILVFISIRNPSTEKIDRFINKQFAKIDRSLNLKLNKYRVRAQRLYQDFKSNNFDDSVIQQGESFIITERGVIKKYFGEIFYFKYKDIPEHSWVLINGKNHIYFLNRLGKNEFFLKNLLNLKDNFILNYFAKPFYSRELSCLMEDIPLLQEINPYDDVKEAFFYNHVLESSNKQLILHLKFSKRDVNLYLRKNSIIFLFLGSLVFLVLLLIFSEKFYPEKIYLKKIIGFLLAINLYLFISMLNGPPLYIAGLGIEIKSLYTLLPIFLAGFYFIFLICKINLVIPVRIVFSNLLMLGTMYLSVEIVDALNFNLNNLKFHLTYLTFIIILFILHFLSLIPLRQTFVKWHFPRFLSSVFFQSIIIVIGLIVLKLPVFPVICLSIIILVLPFIPRNFLIKLLVIFLISVSIFQLIVYHSEAEKKDFIQNNLKSVFLNQNNYAKFIAREIVQEIRSRGQNVYDFFQQASNSDLKEIWNNSLASRENIASGIFFLSNNGEILRSYNYQIPYLKVELNKILPIWSIADDIAELYGRSVPLAVASLSIFQKRKRIGYIVAEVLNLPELILRYKDEINVFTLNRKIDGSDISYIKVDEKSRIIENPSNINLNNISAILKNHNQWISFKFMESRFNGYIFKYDTYAIIIFYPEQTLAKNISESIKIFLFLLGLFLLLNFKEIYNFEWKSVYYSFSIRVFTFLILISMFTIIVFSIFSLNFTSNITERRVRKIIFERGRSVQNFIYNLIERGEQKGELNENDIFVLSKIYDSDINVYEDGQWFFSSNNKKVINSQVPNHLDSKILNELNVKNQEFALRKEEKGFNLYIKVKNYIFNIDFTYKMHDIFPGQGSYSDFIFTLIFILTVIGFTIAFLIRNKILSPIHGLNEGMAEVEKGNLYKLRKIPIEIELRNLYLGFNSMVDGIKEQKKNISEISRMKTLVKLGRRVAHEVKNPLTPIKLSAEQILHSIQDKGKDFEKIIKKSVNFIIDETEHLKKVSYGFLDLSKLDEISVEEFDFLRIINDEVNNFRQLYADIQFPVKSDSKNLHVALDKTKIKQIIKNLLVNSV